VTIITKHRNHFIDNAVLGSWQHYVQLSEVYPKFTQRKKEFGE